MEAVASRTSYSSFTQSVELTVHTSMLGTTVRYDLQQWKPLLPALFIRHLLNLSNSQFIHQCWALQCDMTFNNGSRLLPAPFIRHLLNLSNSQFIHQCRAPQCEMTFNNRSRLLPAPFIRHLLNLSNSQFIHQCRALQCDTTFQ
jgi:hypothetical protein